MRRLAGAVNLCYGFIVQVRVQSGETGLATVAPTDSWWRPRAGYVWRDDLEAAQAGGKLRPGPWLLPKGITPLWYLDPKQGSKVEQLPIRSRWSIVQEFAALSAISDEARLCAAIQRFANRHGWLGQPEDATDRVTKRDWLKVESLWIWRSEIDAIGDLLDLHEEADNLAQRRPDPKLRKEIIGRLSVKRHGPTDFIEVRGMRTVHLVEHFGGPVLGASSHQLAALLLDVIEAEIQSKLSRQLSADVRLGSAGDLRFRPATLLSAMYLDLALAWTSRSVPEKRCLMCRRWFRPTKKGWQRASYCSDTCRSKARYRRETQSEGKERIR